MNSFTNDYKIDFSLEETPVEPLVKKVHFRDKPFSVRQAKFKSLMSKTENSQRVPIICELHENSKQLLVKSDLKFLTHEKMILKNFQNSVRSKLNCSDDQIIFFYHNKNVLKIDQSLGELYQKHKAEDGFLYLKFSEIKALG